MVARRGYVHNTVGNMVMQKTHPDFEHGAAYTKRAATSGTGAKKRSMLRKEPSGDSTTSWGSEKSSPDSAMTVPLTCAAAEQANSDGAAASTEPPCGPLLAIRVQAPSRPTITTEQTF